MAWICRWSVPQHPPATVLGIEAEVAKQMIKTWLRTALLYLTPFRLDGRKRNGVAVEHRKRPTI